MDKTFGAIRKEMQDISCSQGDGMPDDSIKNAGFFLRLLAFIIDLLILLFFSVLMCVMEYVLISSSSVFEINFLKTIQFMSGHLMIAGMLLEMFYFTYFHAVTGQTPGKWICGIKVVGKDGQMPGYIKSFFRYLGYMLSWLPFCLGFAWIAFDKKKQGWHDKITGCFVVRC